MSEIKKIKSRAELAALREKHRDSVLMRIVSDEPEKRTEVLVAMAECGTRVGARAVLTEFFEQANAARLDNVSVIAVDCMGKCQDEPTVEIKEPGKPGVVYRKVTPALAKEIVDSHLKNGSVVEKAVLEVLK